MERLDKIVLTSAITGGVISLGITALRINQLYDLPWNGMLDSGDISRYIAECFAPVVIGVTPMIVAGITEIYKDARNYLNR